MWRQYTGFSRLRRPDVQIIQGSVLGLDPRCRRVIYIDKHAQNATLPYDYAIISTGLHRQWPVGACSVNRAIYLDHAMSSACSIRAAQKLGVVVVGGVKSSRLRPA